MRLLVSNFTRPAREQRPSQCLIVRQSELRQTQPELRAERASRYAEVNALNARSMRWLAEGSARPVFAKEGGEGGDQIPEAYRLAEGRRSRGAYHLPAAPKLAYQKVVWPKLGLVEV